MPVQRKRVIIDFGRISSPYCGLGEVSLNYAQSLESLQDQEFEFVYIASPALLAAFNEQVGGKVIVPRYSGLTKVFYHLSKRKDLLYKPPSFDLYHYLHFASPWGPCPSSENEGAHFLLTVHDFHAVEKRGTRSKKIKEKIKDADFITFVSDFTYREYQKLFDYPEKPTRVIKNGIPPLYRNVGEDLHVFQKKYGRFLFTLGGMKRKNIFSLLGMLEKCRDYTELKDLKLLIAGRAKKRFRTDLIKKIDAMQLNQQAIFLGAIEKEKKIGLMKACRAFVFPSLQEGFGLPIIEAMQFGKPVFCSDRTSLPEVGGDAAYYWRHFESNYMAKVLKEGLQDYDSKPEKKIKMLKEHARSFTQDKNTQAYLQLYKDMLVTK